MHAIPDYGNLLAIYRSLQSSRLIYREPQIISYGTARITQSFLRQRLTWHFINDVSVKNTYLVPLITKTWFKKFGTSKFNWWNSLDFLRSNEYINVYGQCLQCIIYLYINNILCVGNGKCDGSNRSNPSCWYAVYQQLLVQRSTWFTLDRIPTYRYIYIFI